MPIHKIKLRKVLTQEMGVMLGAADPAAAVRDALLVYGPKGYEIESVDGRSVCSCSRCSKLIFDGDPAIKDIELKVFCGQCFMDDVDVVVPETAEVCDAVA